MVEEKDPDESGLPLRSSKGRGSFTPMDKETKELLAKLKEDKKKAK